jgi:hypothetical protein
MSLRPQLNRGSKGAFYNGMSGFANTEAPYKFWMKFAAAIFFGALIFVGLILYLFDVLGPRSLIR